MGKLRAYQIDTQNSVTRRGWQIPIKNGHWNGQATFDSQRVFQKHPETIFYVRNTWSFFNASHRTFFPPNMKYSHRNPVKKSWIDSLHSLTGGLNIRWLKVDCADHSACAVLTRVFIIWVIKIGRPNNDYWIPKNKIIIIMMMMIIICGAHCLERICFNLQFPKSQAYWHILIFLVQNFQKNDVPNFLGIEIPQIL